MISIYFPISIFWAHTTLPAAGSATLAGGFPAAAASAAASPAALSLETAATTACALAYSATTGFSLVASSAFSAAFILSLFGKASPSPLTASEAA
jgi:hypothetical protein